MALVSGISAEREETEVFRKYVERLRRLHPECKNCIIVSNYIIEKGTTLNSQWLNYQASAQTK